LQLVRIGSAGFREVATWRYARLLRWRYRWHVTAPPVLLAGTYLLLPAVGGAIAVSAVAAGMFGLGWAQRLQGRRPVAFPTTPTGEQTIVRHHDLASAVVLPGPRAGPMAVRVSSDAGPLEVDGAAALRVASLALARVNVHSGDRDDVELAIRFVADHGSGDAYLASAATQRWEANYIDPRLPSAGGSSGTLVRLPSLSRLAMEIAVHDASERHALDGELSSLEQAWREAEEIAAIADDLLLPVALVERLRRLRASSAERR
jgi:hypothetical protein